MERSTKEQVTFLAIRYISLIGESLSQALKSCDFQDVKNGQKIVNVLEMCFDRCEHIAQYALETGDDEQWKLQNLARDVEWLQIVMDANKTLLTQGVQRHSTKPTPDMVQQLLIKISQLAVVN